MSEDERLLADAWKKGGLVGEKEARKQIVISKEGLNRKVYD